MEQFVALLEHEHLLGDRIFACGEAIAKEIGKITDGNAPPLDKGRWISPPDVDMVSEHNNLRRAIAFFVHLINHFADQVHLQAEEAMISVAVACGMRPKDGQWVIGQHNQARAYWNCLNIAWQRIADGDSDDRWFALVDFQKSVEAFVFLFKAHAVRENDQFYEKAEEFIKGPNDQLVLNIIQHSGPSDISPYVSMVGQMEALLGIPSPPQPAAPQ